MIEVTERVSAHGELIAALDEEAAARDLRAAYADGLRAVAVVCLHGYRYPAHEARIGEIARDIGFTQVSESHATSPLMKLVSRGDTTVVDAYLSPILSRYVDRVTAELNGTPVLFMQSNGGLADAHRFRGKDSILSGPAGGIVGMARTAAAAGYRRVIGFDMGGTSTDVSHYAGEFERQYETEVAGVRMRAPMLSIHTVAAGGGSILVFDGSRYRVGPDSAGADPGPACYRRGGPLTVTDANVMLGRVQPGSFPRVFGPGGDEPLDAGLVATRFDALAQRITEATGDQRSAAEVAAGFLDIAVANMANAIKKISVQRGHDITRYVLATFGGAGGQHACAVADALGVTEVLIHPLAGVLSAYGMGLASVTAMRETAVEAELSGGLLARLDQMAGELEAAARDELAAGGGPGGDEPGAPVRSVRRAHLRYQGTDTALPVPLGGLSSMMGAFEAAYRQRFSFLTRDKPVIVEAVSVEVTQGPATFRRSRTPGSRRRRPSASAPASPARVPMFAGGDWAEVDLLARSALRPGRVVHGPALITEDFATTVLEPGWQAAVTARGDLLLTRPGGRPERADTRHHRRPGAAGDLQQPVHVRGRADGCAAAGHRALGQHQGTPRLLLRDLRRGGAAHRERPAHAGAPGLHGREHHHGPAPQPREDEARRRLHAQRPLPRRHAPARHHRGHPGVRRAPRRPGTPGRSCSSWRPAGITPRSAASPRVPCRPSAPGSTRKAC